MLLLSASNTHFACIEELLLPVKQFFHERLKSFLSELGGEANLVDGWTTQVYGRETPFVVLFK